MFTKRRLRFSIGAMLVLMAGVAVLLNYEVQRAKAIEATVESIDDWVSFVDFRPRANMPNFLASVLPKYWSVEIDSVLLIVDSKKEETVSLEDEYAVVSSREFNRVIELGALDQMTHAVLDGTAFNHAVVARLCRSSKMKKCAIVRSLLTEEEINDLKLNYPHCKFELIVE